MSFLDYLEVAVGEKGEERLTIDDGLLFITHKDTWTKMSLIDLGTKK